MLFKKWNSVYIWNTEKYKCLIYNSDWKKISNKYLVEEKQLDYSETYIINLWKSNYLLIQNSKTHWYNFLDITNWSVLLKNDITNVNAVVISKRWWYFIIDNDHNVFSYHWDSIWIKVLTLQSDSEVNKFIDMHDDSYYDKSIIRNYENNTFINIENIKHEYWNDNIENKTIIFTNNESVVYYETEKIESEKNYYEYENEYLVNYNIEILFKDWYKISWNIVYVSPIINNIWVFIQKDNNEEYKLYVYNNEWETKFIDNINEKNLSDIQKTEKIFLITLNDTLLNEYYLQYYFSSEDNISKYGKEYLLLKINSNLYFDINNVELYQYDWSSFISTNNELYTINTSKVNNFNIKEVEKLYRMWLKTIHKDINWNILLKDLRKYWESWKQENLWNIWEIYWNYHGFFVNLNNKWVYKNEFDGIKEVNIKEIEELFDIIENSCENITNNITYFSKNILSDRYISVVIDKVEYLIDIYNRTAIQIKNKWKSSIWWKCELMESSDGNKIILNILKDDVEKIYIFNNNKDFPVYIDSERNINQIAETESNIYIWDISRHYWVHIFDIENNVINFNTDLEFTQKLTKYSNNIEINCYDNNEVDTTRKSLYDWYNVFQYKKEYIAILHENWRLDITDLKFENFLVHSWSYRSEYNISLFVYNNNIFEIWNTDDIDIVSVKIYKDLWLMIVRNKKKKETIYDIEGKRYLGKEYTSIERIFNENNFLVKQSWKMYFIDSKDNVIWDKYKKIIIHNNYYSVQKVDNKYLILDKNLNIIELSDTEWNSLELMELLKEDDIKIKVSNGNKEWYIIAPLRDTVNIVFDDINNKYDNGIYVVTEWRYIYHTDNHGNRLYDENYYDALYGNKEYLVVEDRRDLLILDTLTWQPVVNKSYKSISEDSFKRDDKENYIMHLVDFDGNKSYIYNKKEYFYLTYIMDANKKFNTYWLDFNWNILKNEEIIISWIDMSFESFNINDLFVTIKYKDETVIYRVDNWELLVRWYKKISLLDNGNIILWTNKWKFNLIDRKWNILYPDLFNDSYLSYYKENNEIYWEIDKKNNIRWTFNLNTFTLRLD